jgi:hypothetical protein
MKTAERLELLSTRRLPARLKTEEVSVLLGCSQDDLRILARAGILRPLGGNIPQNAIRYYAAVEIETLMSDSAFLDKMTRAILKSHRAKNGKEHKPCVVGELVST